MQHRKMAVYRTLVGRSLGSWSARLSTAYANERTTRCVGLTRTREWSSLVTRLRTSGASVSAARNPLPFTPRIVLRRSRSILPVLAVRIGNELFLSRACSYNSNAENSRQVGDVQTDELVALIRTGRVRLVDVREPHELEETGIIHDAINIPGEKYHALILSVFSKTTEMTSAPINDGCSGMIKLV